MRSIIVASGKGGVGKTTISINIAKVLSHRDRCGLIDADLACPNIPIMLGIDEDERVNVSDGQYHFVDYDNNLKIFSMGFILPSGIGMSLSGDKRGSLIHEFFSKLDFDNDEIEYLIVDMPPGSGDESIAVIENLVSLTDSASAIIVTTGKRESVEDAKRVIAMLNEIPFPVSIIGIVQNMGYIQKGKNKITLFDDGVNIENELGCGVLDMLPFKNPLNISDFQKIKKGIEEYYSGERKEGKEDGK